MGISHGNLKIIPAPFVEVRKSYNTSQDGTPVGSVFNITLQGTLLPTKGSPSSTGVFYAASGSPSDESLETDAWMQSLIRKKEALRQLFSWQGSGFRIDGFDGYSYMTCNPRIKSLNFAAGNPISWANQLKYTVELEADTLYLAAGAGIIEDTGLINSYKIESADETWNIEPIDENVQSFRLTHQINAKGKRHYDRFGNVAAAWTNAREYVLTKIGLNQDRIFCSGVLNLTSHSGFNYVRAQRQDDLGGTFGVTETWLALSMGPGAIPATEDFDVNQRSDETGLTTVTIQGRIQGLQVSNNQTGALLSTKFYNASGKFAAIESQIFQRAQTYGGVVLNTSPINTSVGRNPTTGLINYSAEYNNRPSTTISGARSEKIVVSYANQTDIFAELAILGRIAGPLVQTISTRTGSQKTVSIEAILPAKTNIFTPTQPDGNSLASGYVPSATFVYKSQDQESSDQNTGRYSKVVSWKYNN